MDQELIKSKVERALIKYAIPGCTMEAITRFREAEALECVDPDSRKVIGRHRADIKSLRPMINRKRIDLNKAFETKNKTVADLIESELNKSFDVFDAKIKTYDRVAADIKVKKDLKKALKKKIEEGKINWYFR